MSGLQSGDTILSHISLREEYMARLVELSQSKAWKNLRKEIKKIIGLLRLQTVEALEAISAWRQGTKKPYMWRGHNYVLYLVTSLDFLAACQPALGKWLAVPLKRNPLLQPEGVLKGGEGKRVKGLVAAPRVHAALALMKDEENMHGKTKADVGTRVAAKLRVAFQHRMAVLTRTSYYSRKEFRHTLKTVNARLLAVELQWLFARVLEVSAMHQGQVATQRVRTIIRQGPEALDKQLQEKLVASRRRQLRPVRAPLPEHHLHQAQTHLASVKVELKKLLRRVKVRRNELDEMRLRLSQLRKASPRGGEVSANQMEMAKLETRIERLEAHRRVLSDQLPAMLSQKRRAEERVSQCRASIERKAKEVQDIKDALELQARRAAEGDATARLRKFQAANEARVTRLLLRKEAYEEKIRVREAKIAAARDARWARELRLRADQYAEYLQDANKMADEDEEQLRKYTVKRHQLEHKQSTDDRSSFAESMDGRSEADIYPGVAINGHSEAEIYPGVVMEGHSESDALDLIESMDGHSEAEVYPGVVIDGHSEAEMYPGVVTSDSESVDVAGQSRMAEMSSNSAEAKPAHPGVATLASVDSHPVAANNWEPVYEDDTIVLSKWLSLHGCRFVLRVHAVEEQEVCRVTAMQHSFAPFEAPMYEEAEIQTSLVLEWQKRCGHDATPDTRALASWLLQTLQVRQLCGDWRLVFAHSGTLRQTLLGLSPLRALEAKCSRELAMTAMRPPRGWRKVVTVSDPLGESYRFLVAVKLREDEMSFVITAMCAGEVCECAELSLSESVARDFVEPSSCEMSSEEVGCALVERVRVMRGEDTQGVGVKGDDTPGVRVPGEWLVYVQRSAQRISRTQFMGLMQVKIDVSVCVPSGHILVLVTRTDTQGVVGKMELSPLALALAMPGALQHWPLSRIAARVCSLIILRRDVEAKEGEGTPPSTPLMARVSALVAAAGRAGTPLGERPASAPPPPSLPVGGVVCVSQAVMMTVAMEGMLSGTSLARNVVTVDSLKLLVEVKRLVDPHTLGLKAALSADGVPEMFVVIVAYTEDGCMLGPIATSLAQAVGVSHPLFEWSVSFSKPMVARLSWWPHPMLGRHASGIFLTDLTHEDPSPPPLPVIFQEDVYAWASPDAMEEGILPHTHPHIPHWTLTLYDATKAGEQRRVKVVATSLYTRRQTEKIIDEEELNKFGISLQSDSPPPTLDTSSPALTRTCTFAEGPIGMGIAERRGGDGDVGDGGGDGDVVVVSVEGGSAAHTQGVRVGDVVVTVDGQQTSSTTLGTIAPLLRTASRPQNVTFKRSPDASKVQSWQPLQILKLMGHLVVREVIERRERTPDTAATSQSRSSNTSTNERQIVREMATGAVLRSVFDGFGVSVGRACSAEIELNLERVLPPYNEGDEARLIADAEQAAVQDFLRWIKTHDGHRALKSERKRVAQVRQSLHQMIEQEDDDQFKTVVRRLFQTFDEDSSGGIDEQELGRLLGKLGVSFSPTTTNQLFALLDTDDSGAIDPVELQDLIVENHRHRLLVQRIQNDQIFQKISEAKAKLQKVKKIKEVFKAVDTRMAMKNLMLQAQREARTRVFDHYRLTHQAPPPSSPSRWSRTRTKVNTVALFFFNHHHHHHHHHHHLEDEEEDS